jgi:hypothetical protein
MATSTRGRWARSRQRLTTRRLSTLVAVLIAMSGVLVGAAGVANASVPQIVCGGEKHGAGWYTSTGGGYTSEGCGAGIDLINTPTSSYSRYYFGFAAAGQTYNFDAWIPAVATAKINFHLFACGQEAAVSAYVNENDNLWWVTLFSLSGTTWQGCEVYIDAYSGMVSGGYVLGLDAVSSHTEPGTHLPYP